MAAGTALLLWAVLTSWPLAFAAEAVSEAGPDTAGRQVDFARDIQPILAKRCFSCHGPDQAEGGLRLHQDEAARAELDSGEHAIVPGDVEASALVSRISAADESLRMPLDDKPLSAEEIALVTRWIRAGAPWKNNWAFEPPQPHEPPVLNDPSWVASPIDAFILARLEQAGLAPSPPADRLALIRRTYYDLTGLPPPPDAVAAFAADASPDAYEKLVDRLLASPHYGERWGRHWLDSVRFAETNSFERDGVKPNAWRYRDYVIRSFNDDKPYDQFVREQLAGDELPEATTESIIATGYYRLGLWDDEPADELQARFDELDDIVATTSQVFLGLTINCARCHDHKIDPIPQTDYYRLLAFFHELYPYGTRADQTSWNQADISPADVAARHHQLDRQKSLLRGQMIEIEQRGIAGMPAEDQRASEGPERKKLLKEKLFDYLAEADRREYSELKRQLRELSASGLPPRQMALAVKCMPQPPPTHVLLRGNPHLPGEEVQPGFPELFKAAPPVIPTRPPGQASSGRRLALANWITSPDNMLTARVMANRIWQHHFGRGIVRSTNNFGQLGEPATHPELLDWLAAELVRGGWRLKPLHKLIMMSSTYRMSSRANPAGLSKDPANDLFWRFDMRRLSAEEIRDSIHAVTGRLNPAMFGPGVYPEISAEVLAGQSMPGAGWGKSSPREQARRSVYIHVKRSLVTPILADFDFPEPDISCAARFATTQPAQALGMLNGQFVNSQAAQFARRIEREAGHNPQAQVERALRLALCRPPDEKNTQRGLELMASLRREHGLDAAAALNYYCLVVLNMNEFIYLD
ncbi:MAG: PSD1 and planctomycete cytochrome C domain-containing protein [Pirellulales bacterium]